MATAIACANGNFTTAATWATVDATSLLDSEANNTVLTTSYVASATSTPGAITIDGIAVKVATRAASPSGTMSVRLATGGVLVPGTEVTINVSDILNTDLLSNGWVFFKFAASVTLLGATAYTVDAKTSVAAMVNLYRNATAANWSRMLRTTTTGALGAGDNWFILGECTAAATMTARTVTMDQTAATDYGGASTTIAGCGIGLGGTLTWGAVAATAYVLQESAIMDIWTGGVMNMGTVATPCPRDSTNTLQFDCAADGDFGLRVWGTLNCQGQSRLVGVDNHFALLNADASSTATSLTVDRQLSAKNGDDIAIAATNRTPTQSETKTLNADAGATSLSLSAGLTNAHLGTSPTQAEVIGLNRAVRIVATNSSFMTYTLLQTGCVVDADWTEWRYGGASTTKPCIGWMGASGSVNLNKCVWRNMDSSGFRANLAAGVGEFTITDCVAWQGSADNMVAIIQATSSTWTITGTVLITNGGASGFFIQDLGGTFQTNRSAGTSIGFRFGESSAASIPAPISGTIDSLVAHSTNSFGVQLDDMAGGTISNVTVWRCNSNGVAFASSTYHSDILCDTWTLFGNLNFNILLQAASISTITFRNVTASGDSTFATGVGLECTLPIVANGIRLEGCNFSVVTGIKVAHSIEDIHFATSGQFVEMVLVNTILGATTEILNSSSLVGRSYIAYQKHEGVAAANRRVYPALGTVSEDTSVFHTASPSEKLAPLGAIPNMRLQSNVKRVAVGSGQTVTIAVYGLKSSDYAGSAPRLLVASNSAAGISAAVLATFAGSASTWVQMVGVTPAVTENCWLEFYVDCDGSVGSFNIDDWTATVS